MLHSSCGKTRCYLHQTSIHDIWDIYFTNSFNTKLAKEKLNFEYLTFTDNLPLSPRYLYLSGLSRHVFISRDTLNSSLFLFFSIIYVDIKNNLKVTMHCKWCEPLAMTSKTELKYCSVTRFNVGSELFFQWFQW